MSKQATGKDTALAFLMMDASYRESQGITADLPAMASRCTSSVAGLVRNRIKNCSGKNAVRIKDPISY